MDVKVKNTQSTLQAAVASAPTHIRFGSVLENFYHVEVRDPSGKLIHTDDFHNMVFDAGCNDNITQYFKGSGYTAAWFIGLMSGTPTVAAGDLFSSHAGWTEIVAYSETVRQTLTLGSVAAKAASNTASKAVFTINADGTTIGGLFLASDHTKSGTSGVLYGGGAFSGGNLTLSNGSTVTVTVTVTTVTG